MILIDNVIVSDEVRDEYFCCDLQDCRGACCIEGNAGAPLEESEISALEDYIDRIMPFMNPEGVKIVQKSGVFDYDQAGEYVTPLIGDRDCVFAVHEEGIAKCAIEKAWESGNVEFRKPISCHLYPIRISTRNNFEAVNYHRWHVCLPARNLGKVKSMPLYKFLKDPLIRKYGKEWYDSLLTEIDRNKSSSVKK
jgi:hypothetical protein